MFPLIVVLTDRYNTNDDTLVLLGQFDVESPFAMLATFFPLFLLCNKSLFLTKSACNEMRNQYHKEYVVEQQGIVDKTQAAMAMKRMRSKESWISLGNPSGKLKQIALSIIALMYIAFGVVMLTLVLNHLDDAEMYCNAIREQNYVNNGTFTGNMTLSPIELKAFENNPELFFWDKCLYQTYPFTTNDRHRCQCRVLVIDWRQQYMDTTADDRATFNLTQNKILKGMLENWFMLEKFRTRYQEGSFYEIKFVFTSSMFQSVHMKAFEWKSKEVSAFGRGIQKWSELEYLRFQDTLSLPELPAEFGKLTSMKYLSFIESGIPFIPESICNFGDLEVLQFENEWKIESLPHCIGELENLRMILVDGCLFLSDVPVSIFNLPSLSVLSLFYNDISYESILEYNLPFDVDINDTNATHQWMRDNFHYSSSTEYWLSRNPICDAYDENATLWWPAKLQTFIENKCEYVCDAQMASETVLDSICFPYRFGDGHCDQMCNNPDCLFDNGGMCMIYSFLIINGSDRCFRLHAVVFRRGIDRLLHGQIDKLSLR